MISNLPSTLLFGGRYVWYYSTEEYHKPIHMQYHPTIWAIKNAGNSILQPISTVLNDSSYNSMFTNFKNCRQ